MDQAVRTARTTTARPATSASGRFVRLGIYICFYSIYVFVYQSINIYIYIYIWAQGVVNI